MKNTIPEVYYLLNVYAEDMTEKRVVEISELSSELQNKIFGSLDVGSKFGEVKNASEEEMYEILGKGMSLDLSYSYPIKAEISMFFKE